MALVNIDTVGATGLNKDEKNFRLDPATWTEAFNVRTRSGEIVSLLGESQVFGSLSDSPYFLMPVLTPAVPYWVWASLTKLWVYGTGVHTEITRAAGAYTATKASQWNGIVFGGIAIVNNGIDLPQAWAGDPGVDAINMTNWPSTHRAKVIRALGPHMIAIHITKGSTIYPHMVRWSHPANPGALPSSWDEADTTKDAGETDLPDVSAGSLVDAMALRGQMYLYKELATWRMRYIGGRSKFSFDTFLDGIGAIGPRCVTLTPDGARHVVMSQDDVIVHDGVNFESIVDRRVRRMIFSSLDTTNYRESFIFTHVKEQEVHICYPTAGNSSANRRVIWNYRTGAITEGDCDFVAAGTGSSEVTAGTWASTGGTWASQTQPWSISERQKTIVAKPASSKILALDVAETNDGAAISSYVQRVGLSLIGQKRDRTPMVDFNRQKMVTRVWPRVVGGPIEIRIGAQAMLDGEVSWTAKAPYDPLTQEYVDLTATGRAIAIEFSSSGASWRLEGYKLDLHPLGEY